MFLLLLLSSFVAATTVERLISLDLDETQWRDGAALLPTSLVRSVPLDESSWAAVKSGDPPFAKAGSSRLVRVPSSSSSSSLMLSMRAPRIMAETAPTQLFIWHAVDANYVNATRLSLEMVVEEMSWNDTHCWQVPFLRATTPWMGLMRVSHDGATLAGQFVAFSPGRRHCSDSASMVPLHCGFRLDQCASKAKRMESLNNCSVSSNDDASMLIEFDLLDEVPCANARLIECGRWNACAVATTHERVPWSAVNPFTLGPLTLTLEGQGNGVWTHVSVTMADQSVIEREPLRQGAAAMTIGVFTTMQQLRLTRFTLTVVDEIEDDVATTTTTTTNHQSDIGGMSAIGEAIVACMMMSTLFGAGILVAIVVRRRRVNAADRRRRQATALRRTAMPAPVTMLSSDLRLLDDDFEEIGIGGKQ